MKIQIQMMCKENVKLPSCHRITFISQENTGTFITFCELESELSNAEPGRVYAITIDNQ